MSLARTLSTNHIMDIKTQLIQVKLLNSLPNSKEEKEETVKEEKVETEEKEEEEV